MNGEDYEAGKPVPTRSRVTGDPWRRCEVIAYLATPIDAHYLRTLLIGLDATVSVNEDGVLVIETPDVSMIRTSGQTTTATAAFAAFKDWESPEDAVYDEPTEADWQAAHDAGEDEEMFYGAAHTCALCGHHARFLGGSVTEPGRVTVHLCHGCDEDHDCYRRWTVYGQRPHANGCRDLYCGGCEEVDPSHADPCDCDDCRTQPTLQREADTPTNEPPVGSVARCTGCGNVYVHKADGWVSTDDGSRQLAWAGLQRPSCGPLRVIYTPEEDK